MTLVDRAKALVQRLNTHSVGGVGIGTALVATATIAAGRLARWWLDSHAPEVGYWVGPWIDLAVSTATGVLPPAIAAAYVGRPKGV